MIDCTDPTEVHAVLLDLFDLVELVISPTPQTTQITNRLRYNLVAPETDVLVAELRDAEMNAKAWGENVEKIREMLASAGWVDEPRACDVGCVLKGSHLICVTEKPNTVVELKVDDTPPFTPSVPEMPDEPAEPA